jgi:CTP:molybdopterin cytidylyltransferase MocA
MTDPGLIVMAAGIGRRYGGLKQIEPIGPEGEIILDYSIYDAKQAGFGKIVFVIKKVCYKKGNSRGISGED